MEGVPSQLFPKSSAPAVRCDDPAELPAADARRDPLQQPANMLGGVGRRLALGVRIRVDGDRRIEEVAHALAAEAPLQHL